MHEYVSFIASERRCRTFRSPQHQFYFEKNVSINRYFVSLNEKLSF
ncbi:unnamed protein product [Callosobruchus maculatus]|uniref:Uncharacterized protein n=1 Tax=Callosobruchus maculatus TaxID=64391 RepID=A0A653DJ37_CALMS|nr:unnamed protein product [Callosobruchus maculatus]